MTINDLKVGMVVTFRNGNKELFDSIKRLNEFNKFFNVDLTYGDNDKDLDIIKVEQTILTPIWERKEIKLSDREIEVLKALKTLGFNWIARDENDKLCSYKEKPKKEIENVWWDEKTDIYLELDIKLFNFIKWEDEKPYNVDELLASVE